MPMKNNTKRKRDFRAALAEAGMVRPDRLTEMMSAIAGGGSQRCEGCGRQTWCSDIAEFDVCTACRAAFRRLKKKSPRPRLVVSHVEPTVVWVDASYRDGFAGLAVVGALGEHTRTVDAVSSTQAEVLALRWAMDIAEAGDVSGLTFRTDCQAAYNVLYEQARFDWKVEQVPREQNRRADHLAGEVRRG